MSTCEPPSNSDPAHLFDSFDDEDPSEHEFFADGNGNGDDDGDGIPPDPLLKSGTFILEPTNGPTLTTDQPPQAQNGADADREFASPPAKSAAAEGVTASSVAAAVAAETSTTPTASGRKGQRASPAGVTAGMPERPNWLPEGWRMECKVRTSGATAGSFDRVMISVSLVGNSSFFSWLSSTEY